MRKLLLFQLVLVVLFLQKAAAQCSFTVNTTLTHVSCYNGTNGSITVSVTGGTAPYQYQLAEAGAGAWQSSNSFTALTASTYPVSVKDATGCIKTVYVTITQPANLVAGHAETDATCTGSNNGSITITPTGGTAPYTYSWTKNGTAYSTSQNLSDLAPGNYLLTLTDANGCSTSPIITTQIKPIALTGFNQDVIANGTGAANASTTQPLDDHSYVFYANGYSNGTTTGTGGLPASGSFTSAQSASRTYQLASYTGNNSLILTTTPTTYGSANSGTLSFTSPFQSPYATLYVVGTTGNGTGTLNYTVNYADATTSTGSISFPDWFLASSTSSSIRALGSIDRISWASPGTFDNSTSFNLFEAPISISAGNQSKVISSVNFVWASSGTARVNVFAVTGYTSTTSGIRINDGASVNVTPSVTITNNAPSNTFCSGQSVTFTANPVNGGSSPSYQWKKNGTDISGAISSTYTTNTLANSDQISVVLTSSLACVTTSTATSPSVTMTLGTVTASVSNSATSNSICGGTSVIFTATPTNGGSNPSYQWLLNGSSISAATSSTYSSSSLVNGDQISVRMTSNIACASGSPATSGIITMTVTASGEPAVSITSVPSVSFSSSSTFAGGSPVYQWYKNGSVIAGATSSTYSTSTAVPGDVFSLKMTSNYACKTAPSAMSNYITMTNSTLPVVWEWFTATKNQNFVKLEWKVSSETETKQYLVQRATSNSSFETAGTVTARNSGNATTYQFTDYPALQGTISYRIIAEELNGKQQYSEIRQVDFTQTNSWAVQNSSGYWQLSSSKPVQYVLTDELGRVLVKNKMNGGYIQITKPVSGNVFVLTVTCEGKTTHQTLLR